MKGMQDAIAKLTPLLSDELLICANGFISRDAFAARDRERNFYMLGSMGQASSIGLGLALARPDRKVVVFDGDGNLLMNLGILAMTGSSAPANLVHLVFDNECYDSTGGQPSATDRIDLAEVAKSCGIPFVRKADSIDGLFNAFKEGLKQDGASFLLVKVARSSTPASPRVNIEPGQITKRFVSSVI